MACSKTKRLDNKDWPLFPTTKSKWCCYVATVNSAGEAARVIADAETRPDYVTRRGPFNLPNNMILVYLYFKKR